MILIGETSKKTNMTKEYTRYFAQMKSKDKNALEWYSHDKIGEESLEQAKEELKHLRKHFSKNFVFRIVRRDYVYKEVVVEE